MKPNGKSIVSSGYDEKVMFFKDVSLGHHEAQLRFRLIHFWEAWNPVKKTFIGLEMLLIDEQVRELNKSVFRVADHTATVSFSWDSKLSVLRDCRTPFDEDSFRFHSYEEFQANSDLKGDLFGTLALAPMSSSRVVMKYDRKPYQMTEQVALFGYDYTKDVGAVSHSVEPWQLEDYQPPCHLQMELQNRDIYSVPRGFHQSEETIPHLGTLHKDMFLYQLLSTKGTRNPRVPLQIKRLSDPRKQFYAVQDLPLKRSFWSYNLEKMGAKSYACNCINQRKWSLQKDTQIHDGDPGGEMDSEH
ncbi:hypothetical protein YC2023_016270 [Brassica napus]